MKSHDKFGYQLFFPTPMMRGTTGRLKGRSYCVSKKNHYQESRNVFVLCFENVSGYNIQCKSIIINRQCPCEAQAIKQRTRIWDTLLHLQGDSVGINSSSSVYSVRLCFPDLCSLFRQNQADSTIPGSIILYMYTDEQRKES